MENIETEEIETPPPGIYLCPKCDTIGPGLGASWHRHHIQARQDGGGDEPENICWLCAICHREWHVVEEWIDFISFPEWLKVPPIHALIVEWVVKNPGRAKLDLFDRHPGLEARSRDTLELQEWLEDCRVAGTVRGRALQDAACT